MGFASGNGDKKSANVYFAIAATNGFDPDIEKEAYRLYEETKEALENFKKRKLNKEESFEDKIKDYIEENIKTADINELAQKLGYTTVYTGVLVKKITGYSFTDFVKRKRCSKAAKMLVETTMPVEQIINEVGYENQSFFRKMFKEKYGETPLKYRKNRE